MVTLWRHLLRNRLTALKDWESFHQSSGKVEGYKNSTDLQVTEGLDNWTRQVAPFNFALLDELFQRFANLVQIPDALFNNRQLCRGCIVCLPAAVGLIQRHQATNLIQRKTDCLRPLYKPHTRNGLGIVVPKTTEFFLRLCQQSSPLVEANCLHVDARFGSKFPNSKLLFHHSLRT